MEHATGRPLHDLSLDELESLWQAAKRRRNGQNREA